VKYGETLYVTLQWQPAVRDGGAAILPSEEDGGRKEVVREHQWLTTRTAEVLVRTGRSRVVLATCAVKRTATHQAGKTVSRRHRRGPRPNPRAHGEGEVKVSSDYELIEIKARERLTPNHVLP
jgi:hypothetical protein